MNPAQFHQLHQVHRSSCDRTARLLHRTNEPTGLQWAQFPQIIAMYPPKSLVKSLFPKVGNTFRILDVETGIRFSSSKSRGLQHAGTVSVVFLKGTDSLGTR